MTILRDATAINDGTTAIMAVSLRNHGDNGGATAVSAVQAPQWYRAILRYSFCRGRDILDIHPSITLSILLVEHSCCTYMEAVTYVFQSVINIFL